MGVKGKRVKKYNYYKVNKNDIRKAEYCCFSDIAVEYNTTRGSIAGKFKRAVDKNKNYIMIGKTKIEREEVNPWDSGLI